MNTSLPTARELATRILTNAADHLDQHATIRHPLGGVEDLCMTQGHLDVTMSAAISAVDHIPNPRLRADARTTARAMLPPVTGTVADYANQLRNLAA